MNETSREIIWHGLRTESKETLRLDISDVGIRAEGDITGATEDGQAFEINYLIELSPDWKQILHVLVRDTQQEGRYIDLTHEEGQWFDETGRHLEEFDGIDLVDISITPFTNTFAIKRFGPATGTEEQIDVLYIDLPKFELRKMTQMYAKVNEGTYRYQDVENPDFTPELTIDETDLVVNYPGLFERE